jgi:UDP-GlcNAc:undecaprenyl-phosphate GlcNAc-1-phosphate transferase
MTGAAWEYAAVFVASLLISLVLTPLMLRLATRRALLDHPGEHKHQTDPVPYLGGLAMVTALSLAVLVAALVRPPIEGSDELAAVLAMGVVLSLVGLLDDLRGLGPAPRLVLEVGAGVGVWAVGVGVEFAGSDVLDLLITVVWVVGITNAFNLLDNMDGLSAGVATISAASCFVIAVVNGQFLVAGLSAALAGCALGFLRHNFHPARIYMGDAGSLYLGFMIAYLALKLRFNAPDDVTFMVPVIMLGIPILDTTLVVMTRLAKRRSPFQGGRDHMSHRIVKRGFSVRTAVGAIYVAAATFGGVALAVSRLDRPEAYSLAGCALMLAVLVGVLLARVPVDEQHATTSVAPNETAASRG